MLFKEVMLGILYDVAVLHKAPLKSSYKAKWASEAKSYTGCRITLLGQAWPMWSSIIVLKTAVKCMHMEKYRLVFWGGGQKCLNSAKVSDLLDNESEVCILIERKIHKYMHTEIPSVTAMTQQICQIV